MVRVDIGSAIGFMESKADESKFGFDLSISS